MRPPSDKGELQLPRLLAEVRTQAGRTQRELGKQVGLHQDTLARYERGVRRVPPDTLVRLIQELGLEGDAVAALNSAWEHDEPYWPRGVSARAVADEGPDGDEGDGSDPPATLSVSPAPTTSFPAEDDPLEGDLADARELEALIVLKGYDPDVDEIVREHIAGGVRLLALGRPDKWGLAHLLHCTVPVRTVVIPMLPVFTRMEHLVAAIAMNPTWRDWPWVTVDGAVLLGDLKPDEYLGINPWSGHEFKLPPADGLPADEDDEGDGASQEPDTYEAVPEPVDHPPDAPVPYGQYVGGLSQEYDTAAVQYGYPRSDGGVSDPTAADTVPASAVSARYMVIGCVLIVVSAILIAAVIVYVATRLFPQLAYTVPYHVAAISSVVARAIAPGGLFVVASRHPQLTECGVGTSGLSGRDSAL